MKSKSNFFDEIKKKYKNNPGWYWLLFTVFSFFILPEYISPFILFIAFIIFKIQWSKEGRLAKVGTMGKLEMVFMCYMLISTLWSPTKLDTLGCAGLWWACILLQIMIYNLARTKERIKKIISAVVLSASINGLLGGLQMASYLLCSNKIISEKLLIVTPFYKNLDIMIYDWLPFDISTNMWTTRASGFFSNPNILATFMVVAFPLAIYLFLNASSRKSEIIYFLGICCIGIGTASTLTRAGCVIILIAWIFLFFMLIKKHSKKMLLTIVPVGGVILPAMLARYGILKISHRATSTTTEILSNNVAQKGEAIKSSEAHFEIWKSVIDYITHHAKEFIIGCGFGMEQTGYILSNNYGLDKPHSHNFIFEIWMELGIIGLIMLVTIICCNMGKLLEIHSNTRRRITLVFAVSTSFVSFFVFGLFDYIFNSPKQIIMMMIIIGVTQAISYVYDKTLIDSPSALEKVAKQDIINIINQ